MNKENKYIQDLAEIRSMMERTSKFLSLSGWSGIMAGIYALAGAWIAYSFYEFTPGNISYSFSSNEGLPSNMAEVILLAIIILFLAVGTAVFLSSRKARRKGEKPWNPVAKRLVSNMALPLFAGGLFILILLAQGLIWLLLPVSLIFYGLALVNAAKFTYAEVRIVGLVQVVLGLLAAWFVEWSLIFWAAGFGLVHIIYGIYMHYSYEK